MHIRDLVRQCDALLHPENYHDYAPNGLQVMGSEEVTRVVTGVTACLELIDRAAELNAQAILVHHGWFWKREDPRIVGACAASLKAASIWLPTICPWTISPISATTP